MAKELDYDSKELIKHCNDAGIPVKSSALASISPEERDHLLNYLDSLKGNKVATASSSSAQTPSPEFAPEKTVGKVRSIRTMTPRPTPSPRQEEPKQAPPAAEQPPAEEVAEEPQEEQEVQAPEVAAEAEEPKTAPEEKQVPEVVAETEAPAAREAEPETEAVADASVEESVEDDDSDESSPTQPEYMSPTGNLGSKIRDMKPRASIQESGPRKPKPKPRPAMPSLATPPKFKTEGPVRKKDEAPAQKPDVKLTAEILDGQSPLAAHIRKHGEDKTRGKGGKAPGATESDDRPKTRGRFGGVADREIRRGQRGRRKTSEDDRDDSLSGRRGIRQRRNRNVEYKSSAMIEQPITVRSLSEAMGRPAKDLLTILFKQGIMAQINDSLDEDTATDLAIELGVDLTIKREESVEDLLALRREQEFEANDLISRPPIVTILGHVDHGKTTLVDTLRTSNVVAGEAGGITQHIAAYQVEKNDQKITFVDTPGHAAFGEMRSRGANVTDIIVLVVAANDGVMPQTVECISHAKAAGVPMIVAMNKVDLPDVNEQKVLQELASHDVLVSEWGGDVEVVRTSGLKNIGIDDLLETILLTAELHEYKAAPSADAYGACLEAFRDEGRGPIAWAIVQQGTLRVGDVIVCGTAYGRVRAMFNDYDQELTEAGPSQPVRIAGLDTVPAAGDHFFVMPDIEEARTIAEQRIHQGRTESLASRGGPKTLEQILGSGGEKKLPVILKADTPGSIEALRGEIEKFEHPEVRTEILHSNVGGVNESDVSLAAASGAIIIAFHVIAEDRAAHLAQNEGVDIRRYNIIYEITQDIKRALEGLLSPETVEVSTGRAIVLQTFSISRTGTIAGCRVLNGTIDRNDRVHVIRDQTIINNYSIASLRREKEDVKTVREGMECGIRLDGFNDIKEGDLLEAYRIDKLQRTLDD
ncbi:translation initiation factor IF-2 [Rubinisphaera sp. ICM_H10]|nr:translation initiation factor IF-2 [Rubinisphaera margarita]